MDDLELLKRWRNPLGDFMGVRFVSATKDEVVAELEIKPELCTNFGTIHGGTVMGFADTLGAAGTIINLPEDCWTTTVESKTNFFRPASGGSVVTGTATPVHKGRRTQVWTTRITTAEGKLVGQVTQTQMILPKE